MTALTLPAPRTANQRLKEGFAGRLALSMVAATALHALVFDLWPAMGALSWNAPREMPTAVVRMETAEMPQAPQALRRPAAPEISTVVPPDQTLFAPDWSEVPELPPPAPAPTESTGSGGEAWFGPVTVKPSLANPEEMRSALEREYPSILKDAGLGGVVGLLVRIDRQGRVAEAKIGQSSGYDGLDAAALKLSHILRFHPALNRETPVSVWVQLPVKFEAHGRVDPLEAGRASR